MQQLCKIEDCEQPITSKETGLCHKHHLRFIRYGTTETTRPIVDKTIKCKVDGCKRHSQTANGVCLMHYKRWKRYGTYSIPKRTLKSEVKCKFCDKPVGKHGSYGMCSKHFQMWRNHGDPLHVEERRNNPNDRGYIRHKSGENFHRMVAEQTIGRKLVKGVEVVHHIDLDKLNNNPDNLIVLTKKTHAAIHQQLNKVAGQFIKVGLIVFRDGEYQADI